MLCFVWQNHWNCLSSNSDTEFWNPSLRKASCINPSLPTFPLIFLKNVHIRSLNSCFSFGRCSTLYCHVVWITIDGVWLGYCMYWTLIHTTRNYKQFTAPPLISTIHKSPQHTLSLFSSFCVFISRSLATAYNSGDSSASRARILSSQTPVQNWLRRSTYLQDNSLARTT
jgi:hypothetical protein